MSEMQEYVPQNVAREPRSSDRPTAEDFRAKIELYLSDARIEAANSDRGAAGELMRAVAKKFDDIAEALEKKKIASGADQHRGIMLAGGWEPDDYRVFADMLRENAEKEFPKPS